MSGILLTGFAPFGGAASNPSWQAVRRAAALWHGDPPLAIAELPTSFVAGRIVLADLLERHRPDLVIATGQAHGRVAVTPEMVAINLIDARIPDNDGARPRDCPIVEGGETAFFSTLPVKSMVAAMRRAGVPAALSYSAGTFVCNTVFYALMHALRDRPGARGGFVHVPSSPAETLDASAPTMSIDAIATGLVAGIRACLTPDEEAEGGTIA